MRLAFVIFDGMTALDFVGMFDPLTRLQTMGFRDDVDWELCARREVISATGGLEMRATDVDGDLGSYDVLLVPGGFETRRLRDDDAFVAWLRTGESCAMHTSVCTGSLLLGAAGLLDGRRATTHPNAFEELATYCTVVDDRVVDEGDLVTARGVTAAIDLGLHLAERFTDRETREKITVQMDYPSE